MDAVIRYAGRYVTFHGLQTGDYIGNKLLQGQWYELGNLEYIRSLNVAGRYADVGAYMGTHSLFFALFCRATQVYSFEPQADAFQKLTRNISVNAANCRAFNVSLSDTTGRGAVESTSPNMGGARLMPGDAVDTVTLDSLNLSGITLMKIDVEGMEYKVLQGAENTLRGVQHLFVELWDRNQCAQCSPKRPEETGGADFVFDKVTEFLSNRGFELQHVQLSDSLYHFKRAL